MATHFESQEPARLIEPMNASREFWHSGCIPWTEPLLDLARGILTSLGRASTSKRWNLAVEPLLANLPWQDLVMQCEDGAPSTLVSLVPSLRWERDRRLRPRAPVKCLRLSDEADVEALRTGIEALEGHAEGHADWCVVMGHGYLDANGVPRVRLSQLGRKEVDLDDWLTYASYRVVIVHSCHSGRTEAHTLGDLGGLPFVMMGMGTDVLLAPVTSVTPGTSLVLHEELRRSNGDAGVETAYRRAIAREPRVALYNVYGTWDSSSTPQHGSATPIAGP